MAHVYTPGLSVVEKTRVRKARRLPLTGQVLKKVGDRVEATDVVARTELPGPVHPLNVANILGCSPQEVPELMLKQVGDAVEPGEELAKSVALFGLLKSVATSPVAGKIESISHVSGQVMVRQAPTPVEVSAYIDGEVVEVLEGEGVVIETTGTFIQGIFGIGGETHGKIHLISSSPSDSISPSSIPKDATGQILVGGGYVDADAIKAAIDAGAAAFLTGGFDDQDLRNFLGQDLGVAITGAEDVGLTLILTEGFGHIAMADKTYALLKANEGHRASVSGATQIRAGVIRPEIIIPSESTAGATQAVDEIKGLDVGSPVRVIRDPYFGALGRVAGLPHEPVEIPTEAHVRILEVELEPSGEKVRIPRSNVELRE